MMSSNGNSPFSFSQFQTPQQQQQQQQMSSQLVAGNAPHIHLMSVDRSLLSYQAKWSDIHDDSKAVLLAVEEKMLEYREESRRLDQCERLYDSSALHKGFELESQRLCQELGSVGACISREQRSLEEQVQVVKLLMRNTEVAVRSFITLAQHVARAQVPALAAGPTPASTSALSFPTATPAPPQPAPSPGPTDFYSGIPTKPSPFLLQTVARFESQLTEYRQRVEELERLLQDSNSSENGSQNSQLNLLQSLPSVMTNVHDFFIHVAAEMEALHQKVEAMRVKYLADCRRRGDDRDPFLEADRREAAKQEIAAKRVHPTLNTPMLQLTQQTPTPGFSTPAVPSFPGGAMGQSTPSPAPSFFGAQGTASAFASSAAMFTPSTPAASSPFGSSMPSFSLFGASTPAPSSSPSLFGGPTPAPSQPTGSLFGAGSTPASGGLFGASSGGLFGAASSPSLFGSPATPAFGSSAPGTAAPIFGMGSTTGAGGAAAKPKPRGPRRK
ncbi:hypothetical protein R1flu_003608 [Riccia fluitans]|uniref:Uncharacterized protein n=1 Tax=Riccia fluitans TaxID=41844 RepID=A0ABD1Y9M2_9MARC